MMGVHFIEKSNGYDLERAVDEFLHYTSHKVAEVQYAAAGVNGEFRYSVMIFYDKPHSN